MKEVLPWLAIAVALVMPALTAWINITIKFAPDAAHAAREVKEIYWRVFIWIMRGLAWIANGFVLICLIRELVPPKPDTLYSLLRIISYSVVLGNSYMHVWIKWILNLINLQSEQIHILNERVATLGESVATINESVADLSKGVAALSEAMAILNERVAILRESPPKFPKG